MLVDGALSALSTDGFGSNPGANCSRGTSFSAFGFSLILESRNDPGPIRFDVEASRLETVLWRALVQPRLF